MKYRLFLVAALAALTVSCAKENLEPAAGEAISTINATWAESETKTVLSSDGIKVLWSPNDQISVFYNTAGIKFTALNTSPVDQTMFTSSQAIIYGGTEGYSKAYLYGIYPYSAANAQEGEVLTLTVPAEQKAIEGSFGRGAFPSIARSKDTNMAFYNVCGGVRFSVSGSGIRKVIFSGNDDESIAGKVKVQFGQDGKPELSEVVTGKKTVSLTAPAGGEFQPGKWYYISLLPMVLNKGYTLTFCKRDDCSERAAKIVSSSIEVKRSIFGSIDNADSDVSYGVGIASLNISPKEVFMDPMTVQQLSISISPSDAHYESIQWVSSDRNVATVDEDGLVTAKNNGKCAITATSDNGCTASCVVVVGNPAESVDLGLSVKWATCNVGAVTATDPGFYYAWGETETKEEYEWSNYRWGDGENFTKYYRDDSTGQYFPSSELLPEDDVAHVKWGGDWRMPTDAEWTELMKNCKCEWVENYCDSGMSGLQIRSQVPGYEGKQIFLPANGYKTSAFDGSGNDGIYWSSNVYRPESSAYVFAFSSTHNNRYVSDRRFGLSVRPVEEKPDRTFTLELNNIGQTKASLDDNYQMCWSEGDVIFITDGTNSERAVVGKEYAGLTICKVTIPNTLQLGVPIYAAFPADAVLDSNMGGVMAVSIPENQDGSHPNMLYTGIENNHQIVLNPQSSLVQITIPSDVTDIASVSMYFEGGCPSRSYVVDVNGNFVKPENISSRVEATSGLLGKSEFWFSVAPGDYSGMVLTFMNQAGGRCQKIRSNSISFSAGQINKIKLSNVVYEAPGPVAIDLGLSVKWASCNIDATWPEEYGGHYQWAGTKDVTSTSMNLDWSSCPYHTGSSSLSGWTKYIPSGKSSYWSGYGSPDNKTVIDPEDDVAHVKWGGSWRMPTDAEWTELIDNCTRTWTSDYNGTGVSGRIFTSTKSGYTDKSIFLPAAGYRLSDSLSDAGSRGYYWSSSLSMGSPNDAWGVDFNSFSVSRRDDYSRFYGHSVRPVSEF